MGPSVARVLNERSAGGVLLVPFGQSLLVALISLRGGGVLALPKGHIEAGEDAPEAAARETREETGLAGVMIAPLEEISYFYWSRIQRARISKRVAFYLFLYRSGSPARHDAEVEGVRFVPVDEAPAALSYPGERRVMEGALAWLRTAGDLSAGAKEEPRRASEPHTPLSALRGSPCTP
jgi:8-oxo-dGTP pyrophosphatase MutT (NUDIX family)